jgi:predicted TIM-barrel fold metal-dependent hydrolase
MTASRASPFASVRPDWLKLTEEAPLDRDVPIVDCHHHLWSRPECPYEAPDLLADMTAGHRVLASVFVECRSHYLPQGDRAFRSLGETEYAGTIGEQAAFGTLRPAAGIVGYVDLQAGPDLVAKLLELHRNAARGRLNGIRNLSATTLEGRLDVPSAEPSLITTKAFREGFSLLQSFNLIFDAWMFHTQLGDLVDLARAFPETIIVLNHLGGPAGVGPQAANASSALLLWREQIARVAACDNVYIKIGGLGMPHCGFGFHERPAPPCSADLVEAWRPLVEHCLQSFGTYRCMFESNFPVDKASFGYVTLWNAFKRLTRHYSKAERERLFFHNATQLYRLESVPLT